MPTEAQAQAQSNQGSGPIITLEQEQLNNFLGPVNGALGGLPVAERTSEYFALFTGAGGTGPEIIDQTAVFISYLVDAKGNLSKPSTEYTSLENLIQNFELGSNVILRNDTPSATSGQIFGKQKITGIGRQVPLLYSQTGSSAGANVEELNFDSDTVQPVPSMLGNMTKAAFSLTSTYENWTTLTNYNTPNYSPDVIAAVYDTTSGRYTIDSSEIDEIQFIKFKILGSFENTLDASFDIELRIRRNGDVVATKTYTIPALTNEYYPQDGEQGDGELNISSNPFEWTAFGAFLDGDPYFDVQLRAEVPQYVDVLSLQFQVSAQSPQGGFPEASTPFWTTGSGDNTWLTASAEISANYGNIQNSQLVIDQCEEGFNFSPIETPLKVLAGDRIRFEYNPETEYFIYEVIEPEADNEGLLKLRLNQQLPSSVNRDNFVLHRVDVNDPVYIILDVPKQTISPPGQPFRGVMLPEFPTKQLKNNIDNLVLELKEKGILPDG